MPELRKRVFGSISVACLNGCIVYIEHVYILYNNGHVQRKEAINNHLQANGHRTKIY